MICNHPLPHSVRGAVTCTLPAKARIASHVHIKPHCARPCFLSQSVEQSRAHFLAECLCQSRGHSSLSAHAPHVHYSSLSGWSSHVRPPSREREAYAQTTLYPRAKEHKSAPWARLNIKGGATNDVADSSHRQALLQWLAPLLDQSDLWLESPKWYGLCSRSKPLARNGRAFSKTRSDSRKGSSSGGDCVDRWREERRLGDGKSCARQMKKRRPRGRGSC